MFVLHIFNCLTYNCKICRLWPVNTILDLPNFYILKKILKKVNMKAL